MALSGGLHWGSDRRGEVALLTRAVGEPHERVVGSHRLLAFETLGSTNDEAMSRLRAGDPGDLWITAERQTSGRGRQGRGWTSPRGNLYASLALALSVEPQVAPQLGFVAGVALASVLRQRLRADARLRIKWPNDMIFSGAKLAGLLLESTILPEGRIGCVVGFGVNCRSHPDGLAYPATDLAAAGDADPDPGRLVEELAAAMTEQLAIWRNGAHFDAVRAAWLMLAVPFGTRLAVVLIDRRLEGTFEGLDPNGHLLLGADGGHEVIHAGDVFLPTIFDKDQLRQRVR